MKMGIAAILMIAILIISLSLYEFYLDSSIKNIISQIEKAEESISSNNENNAYINHKQASDNWDKNMKIYKLQIYASTVSKIDEKISKLTFYMNNKSYDKYKELSYELKENLKEILKSHKVSIENIF